MSARAFPHTDGPTRCISGALAAPRSSAVQPGVARCPVSVCYREEVLQKSWQCRGCVLAGEAYALDSLYCTSRIHCPVAMCHQHTLQGHASLIFSCYYPISYSLRDTFEIVTLEAIWSKRDFKNFKYS